METQSAFRMVLRGSVCGIGVISPVVLDLKNRTFLHLMMCVFLTPSAFAVCEYSQDRMAKKRAPFRRCPRADVSVDVSSSSSAFQIEIGRHAWLFFAGSESR